MGFDLNRHWQEPSPWAHPTVYATKNLVLDMDRDEVKSLKYNLYQLSLYLKLCFTTQTFKWAHLEQVNRAIVLVGSDVLC